MHPQQRNRNYIVTNQGILQHTRTGTLLQHTPAGRQLRWRCRPIYVPVRISGP